MMTIAIPPTVSLSETVKTMLGLPLFFYGNVPLCYLMTITEMAFSFLLRSHHRARLWDALPVLPLPVDPDCGFWSCGRGNLRRQFGPIARVPDINWLSGWLFTGEHPPWLFSRPAASNPFPSIPRTSVLPAGTAAFSAWLLLTPALPCRSGELQPSPCLSFRPSPSFFFKTPIFLSSDRVRKVSTFSCAGASWCKTHLARLSLPFKISSFVLGPFSN